MQDFDPVEILGALGIFEPTHVSPVTGGWDTAIWRVEHGADTFALRVFRPGQAAQCRRENAVMVAAAAAGLPVPVVRANTVWRERPALLMTWCLGQPLLHAVVAKPQRVWSLGVAMGLQQARIHVAPVARVLHEPMLAWIERAAEAEYALKERLASVSQDRGALLHLDYHPLNIMVDNGRLTCVLDWANAAIGDPRADVARTVCLLRLAPLPPGSPTALGFGLRVVIELAWRSGYRRAAGRLDGMAPFYAWAGSMMLRDLEPKLGRPGVWLQQRDLARMRQWTATWKRQAGLSPSYATARR